MHGYVPWFIHSLNVVIYVILILLSHAHNGTQTLGHKTPITNEVKHDACIEYTTPCIIICVKYIISQCFCRY